MLRVALRASLHLSVALAPSLALAGAWTQPEKHGQIIVNSTVSSAEKTFDDGGQAQSSPRYNKYELQAVMEYGARDWLTVIVAPGLQHVDVAPPNDASRTGFGASELGARARFMQGSDWVLSGQATVRVPGTYDAGNPAAVGYTGFEFDVRGLFGYAFSAGPWPAFIDLQLAERVRTGGPPSEVRADATFGVRPAPRWLLLLQSFNVFSEGSGSALFPATRYHKIQGGAVFEINPYWSLHGAVFGTPTGRNALQESGLTLGAAYKF